jgi:tetratricopeptide (TPR) repeat protein
MRFVALCLFSGLPRQLQAISECLHHQEASERSQKHRQLDQARAHLTQALECAPESTALLMQRAELLYAAGEHAEVVADTGYVLKQQKGNMRAYFLRGRAYYMQGEPDVAVRYAHLSRQIPPTLLFSPIGHRYLLLVSLVLWMTPLFLSHYKEALRLDPEEKSIKEEFKVC